METGVTDATLEQVRRYVLDGSDDGLRRLLSLSESFAAHARRAFRRAGVPRGAVEDLPRSARAAGLDVVDELVATLRAAKRGGYEWVTLPFLLDLVLRKPASAS
jgi:hypothetical protein